MQLGNLLFIGCAVAVVGALVAFVLTLAKNYRLLS